MKKALLSLTLSLALLAGCTGTAARPVEPDGTVSAVTPHWSPDTSLVLTDFGAELLRHNHTSGENSLIPPLSAWLCLSMVANGAEGETLSAFTDVLAGDTSLETLNASCAALLDDYAALDGETRLVLTQSVWADENAQLTGTFSGRCDQTFGAPVYTVDLDSSAAMKAINAWVKKATDRQIPSLLEQPLSPDAAVALLSALSLDAKWETTFEPENTWSAPFTRADGAEETVDYLHRTFYALPAWSDEESTGALLPYAGSDLAFLAVLPAGTAEELVENLTGEQILDWMAQAEERQVEVSLPKFTASWSGELTDSLKKMGLEIAFDPGTADFSAMGVGQDGYPLYLSQVIQKTVIDVAEEGTKAAAVTMAVSNTGAALLENPLELNLNRPFLYGIVDTERNIPLFLGVYQGT